MVVLWKFSEKCLKFFKIGENQRKSLKIAAKQFVFLHFWYLGTAKSKETTSWKPRKQQQTASFPTFFIGWQHKISRIRNFQKIFRFFSEISENFLKKIWKFSEKCLKFFKIGENQRKSLKMAAKQFVFLHFWYLGTAKSKETTSWKPRKQQQTASFPTFFIGWQQKISRFRNFQNFFRKFSDVFQKFLKIFWKFSENFLKNVWNFSKLEKTNAKVWKWQQNSSFSSTFGTWELQKVKKQLAENLENSSKQLVFLHFSLAGSRKFLDSEIFRNFSENFHIFFRNFWNFSEKFLKIFWKCLKFFKIGENQRKSLKIAAKQFVFLHFWYLGTAKSKETTSWKPRKQQQTAGWQQKISRFRIFQIFFRKFSDVFQKFLKIFWKFSENFLKNVWNFSKLEKTNAKVWK